MHHGETRNPDRVKRVSGVRHLDGGRSSSMRSLRSDRILATTALALLLSTGVAANAQGLDSRAVEALIPIPEPAGVPPPSIADLGEPATGTPAPVTNGEAPADVAIAPAKIDATPVPDAAETPPLPPKDGVTPSAPGTTADAAPVTDPVIDKLRESVTAKLDRVFARKNERNAVEAFYRGRGYAPLWVDNGAASERATAAIAYLKNIDAEGLDPADYPVPDFKDAGDPAALADAELMLTSSVLAYARHAQIGRVHFSRIGRDINYNQIAPEPAEILARMADAKDTSDALASYNPPHAGYQALKAKLAEVTGRNGQADAMRIPDGPTIKRGMSEARVPLVRERLGITADANDRTYDVKLATAVKKFQQQRGLPATGNLTSATVHALNGPRRDRVAEIIIANMERWRWLPRDLGQAYVIVNIPDYMLTVINNGAPVWTTKIVVGKPSMPTPLISEQMKYITVNPTWNVPPSIVHNEYLPALQQDPGAMARIGLRVSYGRNGSVHISQPPGDRNALGRIRFNFPNKFLVYQHDTPDKHLFANAKRAFSHGCMRVQDPLKYGEVLLGLANPNAGYTVERLHRMYGSHEQDIQFATPIPVHLTYQTAFVDAAGKLQIRDDVYGRDARILTALKGDERKVADIAIDRREHVVRRQPVRMPDRNRTGGGGFSFFGFLFR
jgi:murein L,D-transpeptidase YcbB/YkuD